MASYAHPVNSSTARRHQNSATFAAAISRMFGTHKKHFYCYTGNSSPVNFCQGFTKSDDEVSARKLAAGLWQLRFMEVSGDGGAAFGDGSFLPSFMSKSEVANGNIKIAFPHCHNSGEKFKKTKVMPRRPVTILRSRNGLQRELQSSLPCIKCSKEEATKLVGERDSTVTALLLEQLLRAQRSINKLKASQKSSKKKVERFLQNLEEEKIRWKQREYQKIQAMLDYLRDKLARERNSRERMELLNTKLVHELAEAKTNYEKEKKEREQTQEICNQLSMQTGEDKAKLEGLLRVSMKLCEEVEEERKMMKMAELWREERVQMKLADAKLVIEDKYDQVVQLIAYMQMFLRSRGAELGTIELEETHLTKHAVESMNIQRILELSFDFSKLDDIFTIYEELRKDIAGDEWVINQDFNPTFTGPLSTIHIVTLDEEGLNKKSVLHQSSPYSDRNTVLELTNSSEFSEKSGENGACNVSARHSKCRASSASKLPRACRNVGTTSSSAKASRGTVSTSPCKGYVEGSFRHSKNSRDIMNPHITRGMRGCIEWPRSIPKANSKVIPLEERVRSQKSQLQNILKHKA